MTSGGGCSSSSAGSQMSNPVASISPMGSQMPQQQQQQPAMYPESTGPAARTLKQMAEQHQMSQSQPPLVAQPQKRSADGQVLNSMARKQVRRLFV
jgi:hypothetical protein